MPRPRLQKNLHTTQEFIVEVPVRCAHVLRPPRGCVLRCSTAAARRHGPVTRAHVASHFTKVRGRDVLLQTDGEKKTKLKTERVEFQIDPSSLQNVGKVRTRAGFASAASGQDNVGPSLTAAWPGGLCTETAGQHRHVQDPWLLGLLGASPALPPPTGE